MIFCMLGREHSDVLTAIYRGTQESVLDRSLASLLNVELGSELAQQLRDDYGREEHEALARQNAIDERRRILNQLLTEVKAVNPTYGFASGTPSSWQIGLAFTVGEELHGSINWSADLL